jgi:hypothetical protein
MAAAAGEMEIATETAEQLGLEITTTTSNQK